MRILFLLDRLPGKIDDGYTLRTRNICKCLIDKGNQIFMAHITNEQNFEQIQYDDMVDILPIRFDYYNKFQGKLYNIFCSYFRLIGAYSPNEIKSFHKELKKIVKHNNIDLIHVQGHFLGLSLVNFQEVPKLLDLADSMTLYLERKIKIETSLSNKLKNLFYYNWYKNIEKRLLENYKIVTVVSDQDLFTLKTIYENTLIMSIPNGINTDFFHPIYQDEYYHSIFFHGTMDFKPNIDAVNYIYDQILPLIRKEIPNLKFFVIGRNPTPDIEKLDDGKRVIVTGKVEDIRIYISKCNIALMPMKSGSGIKNKILEAMSMEKPVITNPMGAEAFDEEIKNVLLIGKNERELAQYIIKLLKNSHMRQEIGKESRKLVKKYSWNKTSQEYENLYKKLLDV
jgi:glycosyltransferase involved in cell wall biosynthesis